MRVALVGAELEENLGLRYMAAVLEKCGHEVELVPFNRGNEIPQTVRQIMAFAPDLAGFSMVFTGRAREFCRLASALRGGGFTGHLIAGGHFACLNCESLLTDFPAFDSVALGEGERIICALADNLQHLDNVAGICYRKKDGTIALNPSSGNPPNLDELPFPKRTTFHDYFGNADSEHPQQPRVLRRLRLLQHQCLVQAWRREEVQDAQRGKSRSRDEAALFRP